MNPMREYIHNDDTHNHHEFGTFKMRHGKIYDTELEHASRLHIFRQNLRYISSINRKGLTYRLGLNHLADKTDEELRILRGKSKKVKTEANKGLAFDMNKYTRKDLPDR